VNAVLRRLVENGLITAQVHRLGQALKSERTLVLAYHNVVPDGEFPAGERTLHLPQRDFAKQLDMLMRTHDVVPLHSWWNRPRPGRPRAVLTFDDAYAGALTAGVAELAARSLPAVIFVAPGMLGSVTWWDALADPATGELPAQLRDNALTTFEGRCETILRTAPGDFARRSLPRIGSEAELAEAAAVPGIQLASHTWSHPNLCAMGGDELATELTRPLEWLAARFRNVLPWLSYPYGLSSEEVRSMAASVGYRGAFRIDGGWLPLRKPHPLYALPRMNVPADITQAGFRLRVAGFGSGRG
jgi:peptidoglycan/xylan/chitin deacetylase (PgdA/CDA1 family)